MLAEELLAALAAAPEVFIALAQALADGTTKKQDILDAIRAAQVAATVAGVEADLGPRP